jgi:hypothetical protein
MIAPAKLGADARNLNDADGIAVFILKKRQCAHGEGLLIGDIGAGGHGVIFPNPLVYQRFHIFALLGG